MKLKTCRDFFKARMIPDSVFFFTQQDPVIPEEA